MIGRQLAHDAMNGVWLDYTPVLTGQGSNPTLGTGSDQTGLWTRIGNTISVVAAVTFGTSGTADGSGELRFSLPVAALAPWGDTGFIIGTATVYTASGTTWNGPYQLWTAGNDTLNSRWMINGDTAFFDNAVAGASNSIHIQATYPAA